MKAVYLDNNATTPVDPKVLEAMLPFLGEHYGNPSSLHRFGRVVRKAIEEAREQVAELLGAHPDEVIFTSGGTEGDNAALRGVLEALPDKRHVVTTRVEHPAVLNLCRYLEGRGYEVTYLSVDRLGRLDLEELRASLREDTALVSIMLANNETGVIFPLAEVAEIVKERGVVLHCDAVQAVGKMPIDLRSLPVDLLAISGHKFHGPKGVGALYVRRGTPWIPLIIGGHHESGRRAGTENAASIVGMGKAAELAREELRHVDEVRSLRDKLERGILERVPRVLLNGDPHGRLPNTSNLCFEGVEGEALLLRLDEVGIAVSAGSACSSGSGEPSHVLKAMGVPEPAIHGAIRFSLSRFTTEEEVDYVLQELPAVVEELRALSPLWPPD
ncbi:MAG TPA: cysteine desulfurase NifS [Deltaproteobacteria bacterium]|nr:cysteine desulfurase NifS [Deltaproteobacteria bacterium]